MAMEIVSFDRRPFAYCQYYDVHAWPQPHFASLPAGSRAIDAFIGEPEMIGRGHGAAFLKMLAARLRKKGAPVVRSIRLSRMGARAAPMRKRAFASKSWSRPRMARQF
jgi:hypothetical protein